MTWHNETYIIGERVKVKYEKEIGVVTRIDTKKGFICVLFPRSREVLYNYPDDLENENIKPFVSKK
ncbi:MAG: hypothetical protein Q8781_00700 [Candidatus Phytoplasma stylosanthis]|uniref:hypothetical protein n=1 Tax=Candidatus Phytoplasma stylosanthis TaxID=2798314 RepID=UPI0029395A5E|nr:hypothetical protein [Candidatus Phytoplasma stylosanthis]MDV3168043.1 hypothetical protein [Candidatus Phytoplasma stylosanthis]MDV3170807.1 hypothetical protein [Candidatus Phytoplasma stylosanthis]MDV3173597.1 hypothetical protein [Candidatus Phytoplasma stylosanthis]MDV3174179.1 hypothetical protein [Candidatus Phytoplasma stylosanthis]MDV3196198.1 hypothetical protein [Candidatus Phytoplasma stylosanthis]